MASEIFTCVQAYQIVPIKYARFFSYQVSLKKAVLKI